MTPWNAVFVGCDSGGSCTPTEPCSVRSVRAAWVLLAFLPQQSRAVMSLTAGPQRPCGGLDQDVFSWEEEDG